MSKKVEYRVKAVTRYIVTEWHQSNSGDAGIKVWGEFENEPTAYRMATALGRCAVEDDQRWEVKYPGCEGPTDYGSF